MDSLDNSHSSLPCSTATAEASFSNKKRNLPGMPDPEAEVIAMSPKTLMATNRLVCEICNKGFQRDQNLQLHRRGHNHVCIIIQQERWVISPGLRSTRAESTARNCERCSKKYAVQSDWKEDLRR